MKKTLAIFFLLALGLWAGAQTSIKVQVPNVVAADEQFNLSFIIEGEESPSDFHWDVGDDFQLVWGPQKGSSTRTTVINGKRTRSSQFSFTYILMPRKTGKFTLPAATATVGGEKISSGRTAVEVVSGGSTSSGSGSGGSSSGSGGSSSGSGSQSAQGSGANVPGGQSDTGAGEISRDDIFLKFTLSRTNVYVGEPVTATLKLYQRVNIAGFEDARFPTFNGFWSQETFAPQNIEFERESLNDRIYYTAVLRRYVLIPQQAGNITIDPAELVCLVNVRAPSGHSNSIFDSFFQDDYRTIRKRAVSDAVTVRVSKLPAGAPASFGGGVGHFTISSRLSKDSLRTHDAASLFVTLSGQGNISLLEAPKLSFPPDFEVYDAKVTENADKSKGYTSGSKTFEYPFIPRSHGDFTIAPVEYSYFDINSGRYVTVTTDAISISVARGNESGATAGSQIIPGAIRKDVTSLGSDIRFIRTAQPVLARKGDMLLGSALFFVLLGVIIAAAVLAWLVLRRLQARRADVVGSKNRAATKMARKRLAVAGGYLKNSLYTAFYEELHRALLGYISDKLNLDLADMSKDNIISSLCSNGVSDGLSASFTELLDACEFARYAPSAGHDAMSQHYETAVSVISSIDASMKPKKNTAKAVTIAILLLALPYAATAQSASGASGGVLAEAAGANADAGSASVEAAKPSGAAESLWTAGTAAYADGDWAAAADAWKAVEAAGLESADLYYNIANAHFKSADYAHAIIYYERALKLDPSHTDARFNLEFAQTQVQDRIESVPEFFLSTWMRKLCWLLSSNAWTLVFLLLLACALACAVAFLLSSDSRRRRLSFFAGAALLVLSIFSVSFAAWQKADYAAKDYAIITNPVSSVKSSPAAGSATDLFILHEGTKVKILDEVGDWRNIELSDGRQGWIKSSDLELI